MSLVLVLAPPALLVTSVVSVQVSPTFAPPLTRGKMLPMTPWICAMKRLPRGVASRFFTRPLWSTKPWITPPFALSTDSGPIGSVPSYLAESTTTCITRPPVVSLRVTTTHAVRPRLCSWGAWPNAVRSTVVWFLASIRYFTVAGAADRWVPGAIAPPAASEANTAGRNDMGPSGGSRWLNPRRPLRAAGGTGQAVSRVLFPARERRRWSSVWDGRRRPPRAAYPRLPGRLSAPPDWSVRVAPRRLFGLAPTGGCRAARCCQERGGLLPHHFTLTLRRPRGRLGAVCFLWPSPSPLGAQALPGSLPSELGLSSKELAPPRDHRARPVAQS